MTDKITKSIAEAQQKIYGWAKGDITPTYSQVGTQKYELNLVLSDLHSIIKEITPQQFYKLKNEILSLIELCDDVRKDLSHRAHRIEQAIQQISREKYNGELWREVLNLARDMKKNSDLY